MDPYCRFTVKQVLQSSCSLLVALKEIDQACRQLVGALGGEKTGPDVKLELRLWSLAEEV